jgi:hypothetical protein
MGVRQNGNEEKRREEKGRQEEVVAPVPQLRASLEMRNLVSPVMPADKCSPAEFVSAFHHLTIMLFLQFVLFSLLQPKAHKV